MNWTTDKPTQKGVYLLRGWWIGHENEHVPVEIIQYEGELRLNMEGRDGVLQRDYYLMDDMDPDFEWCGPLIECSELLRTIEAAK